MVRCFRDLVAAQLTKSALLPSSFAAIASLICVSNPINSLSKILEPMNLISLSVADNAAQSHFYGSPFRHFEA